MKLTLLTTTAAVLAFGLPALAQDTATPDTAAADKAAEEAPKSDVTADTVVAKVGDTEITVGNVLTVRRQLPQQYAQMPNDVLLKGIVDQLVDQYLFSQQADADNLPKGLALRLENDRRAILATSVIRDIASAEVPDDEIQAAYDEAYGNVEPKTEYNASHILVKTEEEAKQVEKDLKDGADFAELAKKRSTGPSGEKGGELGWFGMGQMVPEFEQAVAELKPGEISEPIQTQFGWHVVKLNDEREVPPPKLEEVRDQLVNQIKQRRVEERLAELRADAEPEIMTDKIDPSVLDDANILPN